MLGHKNASNFGAPQLRTTSADGPPMRFPVTPARRARTILVADSNYMIASELTFAVQSLGYTVIGPVTDGVEALELARRRLPDLAVVSIPLPGIDGLLLTRQLTHTFGIPCIITSGCSDPGCVVAAHAQGASHYLVKPVQDEDLRAAIDLAWQRHCSALQRVQDHELAA